MWTKKVTIRTNATREQIWKIWADVNKRIVDNFIFKGSWGKTNKGIAKSIGKPF